jgi:hypothetical protein
MSFQNVACQSSFDRAFVANLLFRHVETSEPIVFQDGMVSRVTGKVAHSTDLLRSCQPGLRSYSPLALYLG